MATATKIQAGGSVDYTPGSAVSVGDVIVQNKLVGVASHDIASGALGSIDVEGVFDFPKATSGGSAIAAGKLVYWDVADQEAKENSESSANPLLGITVLAAVDADTTVRVRLAHAATV